MDWSSVGALAGLILALGGYLTVRMERMEDRLSIRIDRVEGRLARLEDAYIRHLEQHAAH